MFRLVGENLIHSYFTFRSNQRFKNSVEKEKRDLEKEKVRSPNNAWKSYFKTWDQWKSQSFLGLCPCTPQNSILHEKRSLAKVLGWNPEHLNKFRKSEKWKNMESKFVNEKYISIVLKLLETFQNNWSVYFIPILWICRN